MQTKTLQLQNVHHPSLSFVHLVFLSPGLCKAVLLIQVDGCHLIGSNAEQKLERKMPMNNNSHIFCPIHLCQHAISLKPTFSTLSCCRPLAVLFIENYCSTFLYVHISVSLQLCLCCFCLFVYLLFSVCLCFKTSKTLLTTGSVARASLSVGS